MLVFAPENICIVYSKMNFNFKPWRQFHFSEMTSLPSKLTVRSFLRGNFPLWPCECFALQLSSVTERWKMPPHQEQNVGNYFFVMKNHYTTHGDQTTAYLQTQTDETRRFPGKMWHFSFCFCVFSARHLSVSLRCGESVRVCGGSPCARLVNWTH